MAPGGARGGMGWAILAAALAVPSFLLFSVWSRMKTDHERGVAAKARSRVAEGGVFQTPPAGGLRPAVPVAASTAAPAAVPAAGPAGAAPATAAAKTAPPAAAPAAPAAPLSASVSAPTAAPAAIPPTVSSAAVITLSRDPMMSPMDLVRQREAELEAERNAEALRRAAEERGRPRKKVVRREPRIETGIELQGIVARPDGENLAIVNGATVNPGEAFAVEGFSSKVKVVRITSTEVTFEYKNRRFKKSVNAE